MNWVTFALVGLLAKSVSSFLAKVVLNRRFDPYFYIIARWFLVSLLGLGVLFYTQTFTFQFTPQNLALLFLESVLSVGVVSYFVGLEKVEISRANILGSISVPISIMAGAVFFGEAVTSFKITAFLLIVLAFIVIDNGTKTLWQRYSKYDLLIVLGSIFDPLIYMVDKALIVSSNPETILVLAYFCSSLLLLLLNFRRGKAAGKTYKDLTFWKVAIPDVILLFISYLGVFSSFAVGEISKVYIILQAQVIIVTLMAVVFLREYTNLRAKIIASVLCFTAMILVM